MGKRYTFRPLRGGDGSGFERIAEVKEYKAAKKAGNELIGGGLCAAMCMWWLTTGKVPTAEEFGKAALLQAEFEKQPEGTVDQEIAAVEFLANKFDLVVVDVQPRCAINAADDYWLTPDKRTLGKAILKYANGEVVRTEFPCFLWVDLNVPQARINGERYPVPIGGSHAIALKRDTSAEAGVVYHYYDPNAGVYEIRESALERFFDTVDLCYRDVYNKADMEEWYIRFQNRVELMRKQAGGTDKFAEAKPELAALSESLKWYKDIGAKFVFKADAYLHLVWAFALSSDLQFPVSDFEFPESDFEFLMSDFEFPMSDLEFPMSDLEFPMSDLEFPVSDFEFPGQPLRPVQARYNRFRRLKGGNGQGFKRIKDVKPYKQLAAAEAGSEPDEDELIIGPGLGAAMVMHWLQQGEVPTTTRELSDLAALQKVFDQNSKAGAIKAVQTLAKAHSFNVPGCFPEDKTIEECIKYWKDKSFDTFGTAISMYVSGKLIPNLGKADHLPCLIWVQGVFQATVNGEAAAEQRNQLKERIQEDFKMKGHVFALRPTNSGYQFYDPNAGVYEIESDAWLKVFFDTVYDCYKNARVKDLDKLNRELSQVDGPKVDVKGEMDLQLVRVFPVWSW